MRQVVRDRWSGNKLQTQSSYSCDATPSSDPPPSPLIYYFQRARYHDIKAAKVCAGWHTKIQGDQIFGGFNPEVDDFGTDAMKFDQFCQVLFKSNAAKLPRRLLHLLGMSVVRHYDTFVESLAACKKWKVRSDDPTSAILDDHPFIAQVKISMEGTAVSEETFSSWKMTVANSFNTRNFYARRIRDIKYDQRTGLCIDSRPLIPFAMNLAGMIESNSTQIGAVAREVRTVSAGEQSRQETIARLESMVLKLCEIVQKLAAGDGNIVGALLRDENAVQPITLPFHVIISKYTDNAVIAPETLFQKWFVDDLPASIDLTVTVLAGKLQEPKRKKYRQKFSKWKTVMNVLLRFAKKYPGTRPTPMGTPEWNAWHSELRELSIQATEDAKIRLQATSTLSILFIASFM